MDNQRRELFCLLKSMIAVDQKQFMVSTACSLRDEGWTHTDRVFTECYKDLILSARNIYLRTFNPDWLQGLNINNIPDWNEILIQNSVKHGNSFYLHANPKLIEDLYDFWITPGLLIPNSGGSFIRPTRVVMEFELKRIPVERIMNVLSSVGSVSNPWAGGFESVGKWINKRCQADQYIYMAHHNLQNILFFGGENQIKGLVNSFLSAGLKDKIEEYMPGYWDKEFYITPGESVQQAASRILQETRTK